MVEVQLILYFTTAFIVLPRVQAASAQEEAAEPSLVATFHSFIRRHGRQYQPGSLEYEQRLALYGQRIAEAEAHNSRPRRLWTAGINMLSDRTEIELAQLRGWRGRALPRSSEAHDHGAGRSFLEQRAAAAPSLARSSYSWTNLTTLQEAKNQLHCGSCWAVASTTVLEAHAEIHRSPRTFSAQELVSCVANPHHCGGDGGCEGATVELAMSYVMEHGLATEDQYPYVGDGADKTCRANTPVHKHSILSLGGVNDGDGSLADLIRPGIHRSTSGSLGATVGLHAWERLPENSYDRLLKALVEVGPVAISAAAKGWNAYQSGIYDECSRTNFFVVDHAATLVGFGEDADLKEKYYLVQNSWGPTWGEGGKMRLLRRDNDDKPERCGVDTQPEVGTGCRGGPKNVTVCGECGILYDSVVPHFRVG